VSAVVTWKPAATKSSAGRAELIMHKPLIGITCGPRDINGAPFYGSRPTYIESVTKAGGLPILIASNIDEETLRGIYEHIDGVLLAGGGDIQPALYGMDNSHLAHEVDPDRDVAEINVVRWAAADDKPLFGICRGCQAINVALGGTLYRDIRAEYPGYNGIDHALWGKFPRDHIAHTVRVEPTTHLATVIGESRPPVNSLHHQALRDIAPGLIASAHAEDGLTEGIEMAGARFFIGVQWHPEELYDTSEPMRRLFVAFIDASSR
jgi:putative glutamine amidotransferase